MRDILPIRDNHITEDAEAAGSIKEVMNELAFAFHDVNATQTAFNELFYSDRSVGDFRSDSVSSARKYRAISFLNHGAYVLGAPEFILKGYPEKR